MAVDGTYNIEYSTPGGAQKVKVTLKSSGSSLSGTHGDLAFTGGTVSGDEVGWSVTISNPFVGTMKQDFKGTIKGDNISGTMTTPRGSMPFTGKRA